MRATLVVMSAAVAVGCASGGRNDTPEITTDISKEAQQVRALEEALNRPIEQILAELGGDNGIHELPSAASIERHALQALLHGAQQAPAARVVDCQRLDEGDDNEWRVALGHARPLHRLHAVQSATGEVLAHAPDGTLEPIPMADIRALSGCWR